MADAGLSTTGHPAAMAGPILCTTRLTGKLNGEMAPTTPIGTRSTMPSLWAPAVEASIGMVSPVRVRATAALKRNVSQARSTSTRAVLMGLAASPAITRANSSRRSARRTAARSSTAARAAADSGSPSRRATAAATAASMWASVPTGTRPTSWPS